MLDQLVESSGNKQASRRSISFLVLFGVAIISVLFFAYLWSLIVKANDSVLTGDDLELSTLVAPVPLPEEAPPPVEKQPEKKQEDDLPTRKENIARMDESPPDVPPKTSTEKLNTKARPEGAFRLSNNDSGESTPQNQGPSRLESGSGGIGGDGSGGGQPVATDPDEPPKMPTPKPKVPSIVSKGVINGSAISLPKPAYPPTAKAVGASGAVSVQVVIDENGNVISASATSGHPLLKQVAAQAARGAKFKPTLLSGVPVKVSGIIVYNFQ